MAASPARVNPDPVMFTATTLPGRGIPVRRERFGAGRSLGTVPKGVALDFDADLNRWGLTPDGALNITRTSTLLPVLRGGKPLMLKITQRDEKRWGGLLMMWCDGNGAARAYAHDDDCMSVFAQRQEHAHRTPDKLPGLARERVA